MGRPSVMGLPQRVAARYVQATDEAALLSLVDRGVDLFVDTFSSNLRLDESAVEDLLASHGVDAEDLNALVAMRTAGVGDVLKILGGLVLRGVWWLVVRPFLALGKFLVSGSFRSEVKAAFKKALSHEVRATKHIASVAGRLARGEEVHPAERKEAMKQFASILVRVVLLYLAGGSVVRLFSGPLWKGLTAFLGPVTEMVAILLSGPIRAATAKLLSVDMAQFPESRA